MRRDPLSRRLLPDRAPLAVPIRGLIGLVDRYVTGGKVYGYDNVRADGA